MTYYRRRVFSSSQDGYIDERYFSKKKKEKTADEKVVSTVGKAAGVAGLIGAGRLASGVKQAVDGGRDLYTTKELAGNLKPKADVSNLKRRGKLILGTAKKAVKEVADGEVNVGSLANDVFHGGKKLSELKLGKNTKKLISRVSDMSKFAKDAGAGYEHAGLAGASGAKNLQEGLKKAKSGYKTAKIASGIALGSALYMGAKEISNKKNDKKEQDDGTKGLIKSGAKTAAGVVGAGALAGAGLTGLEKGGEKIAKKIAAKGIAKEAVAKLNKEMPKTNMVNRFLVPNLEKGITDGIHTAIEKKSPKIVTRKTLAKNIVGGAKKALPIAALATTAAVVSKRQHQKKHNEQKED